MSDSPAYFFLMGPEKSEDRTLEQVLQPGCKKLTDLPRADRQAVDRLYHQLIHNPFDFRLLTQIACYAHFMPDERFGECRLRPIEGWRWTTDKSRFKKRSGTNAREKEERDFATQARSRALTRLEKLGLIERLNRNNGKAPVVRLIPGKVFDIGPKPSRDRFFRIQRGEALKWALRQPDPWFLHLVLTSALLSTYDADRKLCRFTFSDRRPSTFPGVPNTAARKTWDEIHQRLFVRQQIKIGWENVWYAIPTQSPGNDAMLFDDRLVRLGDEKSAIPDAEIGDTQLQDSVIIPEHLKTLIDNALQDEGFINPTPGTASDAAFGSNTPLTIINRESLTRSYL